MPDALLSKAELSWPAELEPPSELPLPVLVVDAAAEAAASGALTAPASELMPPLDERECDIWCLSEADTKLAAAAAAAVAIGPAAEVMNEGKSLRKIENEDGFTLLPSLSICWLAFFCATLVASLALSALAFSSSALTFSASLADACLSASAALCCAAALAAAEPAAAACSAAATACDAWCEFELVALS